MKKSNVDAELTDVDFARARPFVELFPAQHAASKKRIRASGKGYNARVERVLREALRKGELRTSMPIPYRAVFGTTPPPANPNWAQ